MFRHYRSYTDGFLPEPGTVTDQPNFLVEAFEEISAVKHVLDDEELEKSRNPSHGNDGFKSVL